MVMASREGFTREPSVARTLVTTFADVTTMPQLLTANTAALTGGTGIQSPAVTPEYSFQLGSLVKQSCSGTIEDVALAPGDPIPSGRVGAPWTLAPGDDPRTGGTFTLEWDFGAGVETTAAITLVGCTAAVLQAAIVALTTPTANDVKCTQLSGTDATDGVIQIEFQNDLKDLVIASGALTSSLSGGTDDHTIAEWSGTEIASGAYRVTVSGVLDAATAGTPVIAVTDVGAQTTHFIADHLQSYAAGLEDQWSHTFYVTTTSTTRLCLHVGERVGAATALNQVDLRLAVEKIGSA